MTPTQETIVAKRRANVAVAPVYLDLGPGLVRDAKGRPRSWGGAADVEVADRLDPDHPHRAPVKAARRRNAIAALLAAGSIDKPQASAADRFLDDLSLAQGSSQAGFLGIPASGSRKDYPEVQLAAIRRVYAIRARLGLNDGTVIWWVVLGNKSVREWEDRFGHTHGEGMTLLRAGLDGLADWYADRG